MKAGDRYRHYKGKFYKIVVDNALNEATGNPAVVYQSEETGIVWVTSLKRFNTVFNSGRNCEKIGVPVGTRRFTKVD